MKKRWIFCEGGLKLKKRLSPLLKIGLLILVANITIERFIEHISNWIAIPILLVGVILIIAGVLKGKEENIRA